MMKNEYKITIFYLITIVCSLAAEDAPYIISRFGDTSMAYPEIDNLIIQPITNKTLQRITAPPEVLEKGQVLLRKRYSANEYGLFIGIMNSKTYGILSAFKPEDFQISTFINNKIYTSPSAQPNLDEKNVYFDGDFIYMENIAKIFYFDNEWKEVEKLDVLPCRLNVTSEPTGASVYINDELKGTTPLYMGAINEPSAEVKLEMDGYFMGGGFIDLQYGELIELKFDLKKMPVFDDGTEIDIGDIEVYTAENNESVLKINQRIETVRKSAKKIKRDSAEALSTFIKTYPTMPPHNQFETTEEFEKRKNSFNLKFQTEKDVLCQKYADKSTRILQVIPKMKAYLDKIKEREYTKYINGDLLTLAKYNADSGFFPITIQADEKGFAFTFIGKLIIPREEAKEFYTRGTGSGKIILKYKNWQISIQHDSLTENYFIYFTDFKLKFKDVNYNLVGTCDYPDYIENSKEYVNFLKEFEARGSFSINTKPSTVHVKTFIGTIPFGTTPVNSQIRPGHYPLTLKADGYKVITDSLFIIKDSLVTKTFELKYTQEILDSIAKVKEHKIKRFQMFRRILFSSLTLVTGGIGYAFERKAHEYFEDYNKLGGRVSENNFNSLWTEYERNAKLRNIFYISSGVSLGCFVISIAF